MIMQKTKIVCSIGPISNNDETIRKMIAAGMNIARFNFSHGEYSWHKEAMDRVKRIAAQDKKPVAILLDTKGPEIRTGMTKDGKDIAIKAGDLYEVVADGSACTEGHISISWKDVAVRAKAGVRILIADGLIELVVDHVDGEKVICKASNSGTIGSKKNVNLVGLHAGLPIMSEQDKKDIAFGVEQNIDFVAASFVSFPEEVVEIREYLNSLGSKARIIAKIENEEGLDNIDRIIEESDGVMVARGDLGVQVPTERIPLAQKQIIYKCRKAGKPVITATQMLDSMINNPRPTRAELTDVANAVFDGTDAVMLSGETAGGKYPVESVETMARIVRTAEDSEEYKTRMRDVGQSYEKQNTVAADKNIGRTVAMTAYTLALDVKAKAIISPTLHGNTSRMISSFRPEQIVIAVTPDEQVARQLMLNWGVNPILSKKVTDSEDMIQNSIKVALDEGAVALSDSVVMIASIPLHSPLMANTIKVLVVGNVLARGTVYGCSDESEPLASGRIVNVDSPEDAIEFMRKAKDTVIVCKRITKDFIPLLRMVNGVVTEGGSDVSNEDLSACNKSLVWITEAPDVIASLETGISVTLDGKKGLVYEGLI